MHCRWKTLAHINIRTGSTSRLATREQQMRLFKLGGLLHTETLPVPATDANSLDRARLQNYLEYVLQDPDVPSTESDWQKRLLALGFLTEHANTVHATVAGLVLFGKHPRRYLKQAGLRVFAFDGEDKTYKAVLDRIMDGPMVGRWDFSQGSKSLVDGGLIERFVETIKPFVTSEDSEIDESLRRHTRWFYPLEAIRESLINALAHRDWTRFVEIEVGGYNNRLEIISPGSLPNSMTVEKMKAGQRSARNTIIMEVLRDYGYVDHRSMGVRTKIVPLTSKLTGKEPEFTATEDNLTTILYR